MLSRIASLLRMSPAAPENPGLLFAHGDTVPTNGTSGYLPGCIFQHIDGGAGAVLYVNEGTYSSCDFNLLESTSGNMSVDGNLTVSGASGVEVDNATPTKVLKGGSYSSMLTHQGSTLVDIAAEGASDDWYIAYAAYIRATAEDAKPFGYTVTMETTDTTGIDRMQAGQFISLLGTSGGSESANLKTRGGDPTAGMFATWHKVGGNANASAAAGSLIAAAWIDNQCSFTPGGEEYGIFATTGGSVPDAFIGFETSSSGYAQLFYFDETFDSGAGTCVETSAVPATQDARIKVWYDGKQYYLPLYSE